MIAEICAIREKIFSRSIQNVLQIFWTQKFLHMACTCRHYTCTCSHYTGTTQSTGTIQVSEQLLAIWKRDAYLRSCSYAQRRNHFLMPQQKELSEQVNSMKMIFTLHLKNRKREATSKVSLFIRSVLTGIATRGLFRKSVNYWILDMYREEDQNHGSDEEGNFYWIQGPL